MSTDLVVLLVLGVCGIAFVSHYYSKEKKLKRLLRATPIEALASVPEGALARVIGHAFAIHAGAPVLRGPLTGRSCLMYIVKVEEEVSNGKSTSWYQLIRESKAVPFMLIDESGKALVDPTAAQTVLNFDRATNSGAFDPAELVEEEFLANHGQTSQGWLFNKTLRYSEAVVAVGETIAVLGMGVREPDPEGTPGDGYRSAAPTRMRFTSSAQYPLVISDDTTTLYPAPSQLRPGSNSK